MATLLITKKTAKTWLHEPSDELQFIIGKFTFSIDGDFFQIVELGQAKRNKYNFADITVYDETTSTTYDSFTSIVDLSTTLETLGYPGFLRDGDATGVLSVNGLTGVVVLNGANIDVIDPVDSATKELNDALQNIFDNSGGVTPDLQAVVTEGGVVISGDGLKKVEIDKDNGKIIISSRPTTGDAWVVRAGLESGVISVLSPDGSIVNSFDYEGLKLQSSSALGPTEYKNDRIIYRLPDAVDDFIERVLLLPTAYGISADGFPYENQKLALKPILTSYDFTAEIGVDYETDQDLTVTDPDDQVGSYRVFVANNNATIGGVAYPKGSRIYRYYDGTAWNTIVLATTDDIPTLDATPTNGSTNGVESNGVFDALALKLDVAAGANYRLTVSDGSGNRGNASAITASRALKSDANGIPTHFDTATEPTLTELSYVKGVTSAIQTQLSERSRKLVEISTASAAHTGTVSETQISAYNFQLPANSIDKFLRLVSLGVEKTGTNNSAIVRLKINSTNNYGTATTIATATISAANNYYKLGRTFKIDGGNLKGLSFTIGTGPSDLANTNVGYSTTAFDKTNIVYGFVSIQLNSAADSVTLEELLIMN